MQEFERGQRVLVPCDVQPGPFTSEKLVTIRSGTDVTSGFVRSEFVAWSGSPEDSQAFLMGVVERATPDSVVVRVPGSFFTTASGMAALPKSWAEEHLSEARP
ncbi:MAG: hypothetical protein U0807_15210 [Candidatus Binatia bacterium]